MSTTLQYSMQDASSPAQTKIVTLNGEIDESNQAELEALFSKLLSDASSKNIVFQISNLEYINSSIIGIFAQQHGNFSEAGKNFVFAQANEHIFDIIDLVGLTAVVECFDSVNEACLSFED